MTTCPSHLVDVSRKLSLTYLELHCNSRGRGVHVFNTAADGPCQGTTICVPATASEGELEQAYIDAREAMKPEDAR